MEWEGVVGKWMGWDGRELEGRWDETSGVGEEGGLMWEGEENNKKEYEEKIKAVTHPRPPSESQVKVKVDGAESAPRSLISVEELKTKISCIWRN